MINKLLNPKINRRKFASLVSSFSFVATMLQDRKLTAQKRCGLFNSNIADSAINLDESKIAYWIDGLFGQRRAPIFVSSSISLKIQKNM